MLHRRATPPRLLLLLPLLLAWVQQGAWLHQLSHAYYSAQSGVRADHRGDDAGDGTRCPVCQSFAQVGAAACGPAPADAPVDPIRLRAPDPRFTFVAASAPTPRSRGPPLI